MENRVGSGIGASWIWENVLSPCPEFLLGSRVSVTFVRFRFRFDVDLRMFCRLKCVLISILALGYCFARPSARVGKCEEGSVS